MNKYYILPAFLGIICKLYDDLVDNNLFQYLKLNENYTKECLKIIFTIGMTTLSLKYSYVWLGVISLLIHGLLNKKDYSIYEWSGLISAWILYPFINFKGVTILEVIILVSGWINSYIVEFSTNILKTEFSYKKIALRSLAIFFGIVHFCLYIYRPLSQDYPLFYKHLMTENLFIGQLFTVGYCMTSIIMMSIMIYKENKEFKK